MYVHKKVIVSNVIGHILFIEKHVYHVRFIKLIKKIFTIQLLFQLFIVWIVFKIHIISNTILHVHKYTLNQIVFNNYNRHFNIINNPHNYILFNQYQIIQIIMNSYNVKDVVKYVVYQNQNAINIKLVKMLKYMLNVK